MGKGMERIYKDWAGHLTIKDAIELYQIGIYAAVNGGADLVIGLEEITTPVERTGPGP